MENTALIIAKIALFVTTINVILVAIDLINRTGKKLECHLVQKIQDEYGKINFSYFIYVNNLKANNICVEELSYIINDNSQGFIEEQCFPSINLLGPFLLNAYEAKFIPANITNAANVYLHREKIIYMRIKTSRGVIYYKNPKLFKYFWFNKYSIKKIEKDLSDKKKKKLQQYINNENK